MSEQQPASNEVIDNWVRQKPLDLIRTLPNNVERREAERLIEVAADLAHIAREKKPDR